MLVTPDGQRTMNTFLGACQALTEADVDPAFVTAAQIVYLEGYLWDPPKAKRLFSKPPEIAHAAGRRVALSLSDAFCVDRYRDEFLRLIRDGHVDILFANESELHSLYQTADFDTAVACLRQRRYSRRRDALGKGLARRDSRGDACGQGRTDRESHRHDGRRRSFRRRVFSPVSRKDWS